MRVAVIHGYVPPSAAEGTEDLSEAGVLGQVSFVVESLVALGHEVREFCAKNATDLNEYLARDRPDVVFNCCESLGGAAGLEMNVAALLESLGIPFTGASALTLGMSLDKEIARDLCAAHGVPVPRGVVIRALEHANVESLTWPLIVKPVREDGSIGITAEAVVRNPAELHRRVSHALGHQRQPALVEEYIHGREFGVSLVETGTGDLVALPVSEIEFRELPDDAPRVLTYASKWEETSAEYGNTVPQCPARIAPGLAERLCATALAAARALRLTGYGRVDLRMRDDGSVYVLEVNPNPDLNADAGFMRAARASGRTERETINEILSAGVRRQAASSTRPVLRQHKLRHLGAMSVDQALFDCRFAGSAAMHRCNGACCAEGAWVDVAHRDRVLEAADVVREYMEPAQERNPALWFNDDETTDPDYESGRAISTAVVGGGCVFLDSQRRCVLHRAEEKIPNLKPFFCRAYPIVLFNGVLTVDDEAVVGMTHCCTAMADGDRTIFDLCEWELEHVLGPAGLAELRAVAVRQTHT